MKRVAIIAATFTGNHGAEAMLATTIGRVRDSYPDARFFVYSYYPAEDRALIDDAAITVHSSTPTRLVLAMFPASLLLGLFRLLHVRFAARIMPAFARDLAGCDVLVDLAGVSFVEGREKYLPFNILTIWPAMLAGVPVVKLAQALGPFSGRLNRIAARLFLGRCRKVFARGAGTSAHLAGLRLAPTTVNDAADVAFLFEDRYSLTSEGDECAASILGKLAQWRDAGSGSGGATHDVVGICPSSVVLRKAQASGWDYVGVLAQLVQRLVEHGNNVVLFPNATRQASGKLRNNDLPVIEAIAGRLDSQTRDAILAVDSDMNAANIKTIVGACDAVVVSRFHAMVGALASGIPVAVVGWSHKYVEVMDQFDLGEYVLDHSECTPETVERVLGELLSDRESISARIAAGLGSVLRSSATQFEYLTDLLANAQDR